MADITPIVFENREGLKLFGMLHKPAEGKLNDIGIIILSPGVKTRVAPHRLYNKMAAQFVKRGYLVFRFDFYGLGDAEGEIEEEYLADFYGTVQVGRYVGDTLAALDWIENECGVSRIIFAGLCGGAITGLLAGANDERVIGLLSLGIPVILDSTNIDSSKYITQGQLKKLGVGYLGKLVSIKALFRLLTFRSDYRLIGKVLTQMFVIFVKLVKSDQSMGVRKAENDVKIDNYNKLFTPAFFKMASGKQKLLFIFSGADRLAWEFEEKFVVPNKEKVETCGNNYEVHTIANANHILSRKEWRQEMFRVVDDWLDKRFS